MTPRPCPADAPDTLQLSRDADVRAALHDLRLQPPGPSGADPEAHRVVRAAAESLQSAAQLAAWRDALADGALGLLRALPRDRPVDLVRELADPWCLDLALRVSGLPQEQAEPARALAAQLFDAAAQGSDGSVADAARDAALALARLLMAAPAAGDAGARSADVQTFVALSQSLPALLAGAWFALLQQPALLAQLLAEPAALDGVLDELLRLGSPARAVFRQASAELVIGDARLRPGQRVALMLQAANRDPARYADPERIVPGRASRGGLGLGSGAHHCAGGPLLRLALGVATQALLQHHEQLAWADTAAAGEPWRGGFALWAPAALRVQRRLRRAVD